MKKLIRALIVIAIVIVATISNPPKEEYVSFAVEKMSDSTDNWLEVGAINLFGDTMLDLTTTSKDYLVFTVYTTTIDEEEFKVLGVFNNFIPLTNLEELVE